MSKVSLFDRKEVKFLISVGGIYTSYIYYSLIMEKLFKHDYSGEGRRKGEFQPFNFGFATSLFQNVFSFLLALLAKRFIEKQTKNSLPLKTQIKMSFVNFLSIFLASQALAYVSFPVQAIMKSSKIISILIVSFLLRIKGHHTKSQYACGFIITLGIILFNAGSDTKGKHGHGGEETGTSLIGIAILLVSLFCDGLLGVIQQESKKQFKPSSWDLMESLNKWGGIICLCTAIFSGQIFEFIEYTRVYSAVWTDLILLSVLGAIGQIFIFYTISHFSPLLLSIVTTTRKFFTVLISIIIYSHPINSLQWVSIGLVFTGVFIEMFGGGKKHDDKHKEKRDEVADTKADKVKAN